MAKKVILRPRLHGRRFEDGAISLDFLRDLANLSELVMEVAKWLYLQDHPNRQRAPRGFDSSVEIQLSALAQGSAIPVISISAAQANLMGELPYERYFFGAVESITESIRDAEQGFSPSSNGYIQPKHLAHFNRFGRNLRSDESIEFQAPSSNVSAWFDEQTRMKLLEIARVRTLYKEVAIRGAVSEFDQDRMTFEMQRIDGQKVSGTVPEQCYDTFLDAFNGYQDDTRVLIEGIGKYDRQNRLLALESVERVSILDPLDVPARLDELRSMQDGWLEGDGKAPPHSGLDWLSGAFQSLYPDDIPLPYTYPTFEGGVQFEWTLGRRFCVEIEIDLDTRKGGWIRFERRADFYEEETLNLDDSGAWDWMAAKIRETLERAE